MSSSSGTVLVLQQWTGIVPVLLPLGQPTISSIGVASAGIALPFFFFIVAMFSMLIPIWMKNFESDNNKNNSIENTDSSDNTDNLQDMMSVNIFGSGGGGDDDDGVNGDGEGGGYTLSSVTGARFRS